jgi:hypothetical protein
MSVSLSPLAYLSVFKSATESHPDSSVGVLIGYEDDGVYHITGAFPLPSVHSDVDGSEVATPVDSDSQDQFVKEMVQCLDRVNFEGYPLGIYAAGNVGPFPSSSHFSLASSLKLNLVLLLDLPVFKALRSSPRGFLSQSEIPVSLTSSGAAALLLKHHASWLELHVKSRTPLRVQNFLERCLDSIGRLPSDLRTAQALQQETQRAARTLLLPSL